MKVYILAFFLALVMLGAYGITEYYAEQTEQTEQPAAQPEETQPAPVQVVIVEKPVVKAEPVEKPAEEVKEPADAAAEPEAEAEPAYRYIQGCPLSEELQQAIFDNLGLVGDTAQGGSPVFSVAHCILQGSIGHCTNDGVGVRVTMAGYIDGVHIFTSRNFLGDNSLS